MDPHAAAQAYGHIIPGSEFLRSLARQGKISKEAQKRLRWFEDYRDGGDVSLTCRYFGISRPTFYRWKNRFDPYDLTTLEESSRKPHHVRQSETPAPVIERIRVLRQTYPRWGKEKLAVLLWQEGIRISCSTVGRQMAKLRKRGLLVEPENARQAKFARKRRRKPRSAVRKRKGYAIQNPGDMVQIDTLQIILCPNEVRFQIGARDIVTRMDVLKAYNRQTSTAAADFLQYLKKKFPFKIRAIQIDGGSEFMDPFEEACQKENILLCVNPPRCPEMNGYIERSNRTSREEFYEVEEVSLNLEEHNRQLGKWGYTYNYIRPHQALYYLTPYEYYLQWKKNRKVKCH